MGMSQNATCSPGCLSRGYDSWVWFGVWFVGMIRGYDSLLSISVNTCADIRLIISFATGTRQWATTLVALLLFTLVALLLLEEAFTSCHLSRWRATGGLSGTEPCLVNLKQGPLLLVESLQEVVLPQKWPSIQVASVRDWVFHHYIGWGKLIVKGANDAHSTRSLYQATSEITWIVGSMPKQTLTSWDCWATYADLQVLTQFQPIMASSNKGCETLLLSTKHVVQIRTSANSWCMTST